MENREQIIKHYEELNEIEREIQRLKDKKIELTKQYSIFETVDVSSDEYYETMTQDKDIEARISMHPRFDTCIGLDSLYLELLDGGNFAIGYSLTSDKQYLLTIKSYDEKLSIFDKYEVLCRIDEKYKCMPGIRNYMMINENTIILRRYRTDFTINEDYKIVEKVYDSDEEDDNCYYFMTRYISDEEGREIWESLEKGKSRTRKK